MSESNPFSTRKQVLLGQLPVLEVPGGQSADGGINALRQPLGVTPAQFDAADVAQRHRQPPIGRRHLDALL